MNGRDDGGPAFPLAVTADTTDYHGMSLRDYVAAQLYPTVIKAAADLAARGEGHSEEAVARRAFRWADAFIAARGE